METRETLGVTASQPGTRSLVVTGIVRVVAAIVILGTVFLLTAGRLDWAGAWVFVAMLLVIFAVNLSVLVKANPEVIDERLSGGKGTKGWDKIVSAIMALLCIATLVVAGLDQRFSWSPRLGPWVFPTGAALVLLGDVLFVWAMAVNKYFSRSVRIQSERGHTVVTRGPYRYVRHPGYVGWCIIWLGLTLILGSLWAFIPSLLTMALIVVRTALEDRTLKEELPGYEDYAARVRYRLLPRIW